jgi:hypothetical protein
MGALLCRARNPGSRQDMTVTSGKFLSRPMGGHTQIWGTFCPRLLIGQPMCFREGNLEVLLNTVQWLMQLAGNGNVLWFPLVRKIAPNRGDGKWTAYAAHSESTRW